VGDWAKLIPQVDKPFVQSFSFRIACRKSLLAEYDAFPANAVTFSRRNITSESLQTSSIADRNRAARTGGWTLDPCSTTSLAAEPVPGKLRTGGVDCQYEMGRPTPIEAHMPLPVNAPVRPKCDRDARHDMRIDNWSKFSGRRLLVCDWRVDIHCRFDWLRVTQFVLVESTRFPKAGGMGFESSRSVLLAVAARLFERHVAPTEKGTRFVKRVDLVRIQSSALFGPDSVSRLHGTLRNSGPWFQIQSGYGGDWAS